MSRNHRSDSKSRSRSRSYSRSKSRSRSRDRRDRRSDDRTDSDLCRVHIGDLSEKVTKSEIEKAFGKFGDIEEVWMARNPPCFAFCVFKNKHDAEDAIREMDRQSLGGHRIRVSQAKPRIRGTRRRRVETDLRCYQCGRRGHFSRDCDYNRGKRSSRGRYSRSASRDRGSRRDRRSRSKSYSRTRSYSRSPVKDSNISDGVKA